jgi:orotate phosphoribosyltransferase-like protein
MYSSLVTSGISLALYYNYRTSTNNESLFFKARRSKKYDSNIKSGSISQNMSRVVV